MAGEWLLILVVFVTGDTHVTTAKRIASEEACIVRAAAMMDETARQFPAIRRGDIAWRCAEIGQSDPAALARLIAMDLARTR